MFHRHAYYPRRAGRRHELQPAAAYFSPPITTIRQDTRQAGALLVSNLMGILESAQPASQFIGTELIVRET
ncbi:MAG: substrate-binding domain-containing protein [Gammaproteobacteria bacterium]|nr:substrate-binding domain-containing protein [Gammaproteobacteria bacterium]